MLNPSWADEYNAAPPKGKAYYKLKWNYNDSKYWPEKRLKKKWKTTLKRAMGSS